MITIRRALVAALIGVFAVAVAPDVYAPIMSCQNCARETQGTEDCSCRVSCGQGLSCYGCCYGQAHVAREQVAWWAWAWGNPSPSIDRAQRRCNQSCRMGACTSEPGAPCA